jgi:GNAT superfamily N-acetyltransferase
MHAIRMAVVENRLSNPDRVTLLSYAPYVTAGSAWVAEANEHVLGFAAVDLMSRSIWALFVAPRAEGRGIGLALHEVMLRYALDRGMADLHLSTARGTRAERFYAEAGWQEVGADSDGQVRLRLIIRP